MSNFWRSLRYTLRILGRNPGFTAMAVLSLALGIGANTAIFSLLDALLLRDLPVWQPERLVELSVLRRGDKIPFSFPMFRELDRGQRVFSGLIGWNFGSLTDVEIDGVHSQADVRSVTGNYYSVLGASPVLGRLISLADVTLRGAGSAPVAVLSYEFWLRRFGAASDVIGKVIAVEGQPYTIIGVSRKWFTGMTMGEAPDLTIPIKPTDNRAMLWVFITGRLKDGVTVAQARAQLLSLWPHVLQATPSTDAPGLRRQLFFSMGLDVSSAATGVNKSLRARFTRPLYVLMGIVALILLLACVNLANLILARAAARSHEMGVRVALGASRWALARLVLGESVALSALGGLLGLAFAYWGSRLLVSLLTEGFLTPIVLDLRPDWRVLSITAVVTVLTGIIFGFAPAWRTSRQDPATLVNQDSRTFAGAAGRLGKALIATQIAISLILLLGAGLLTRSFQKLCTLDPGMAENVLELGLTPRPNGYEKLDMNAYHRQLIDRISRLPGVRAVSYSDLAIGAGSWQDTVSTVANATSPDAGIMSNSAEISPGFFRTLGISRVRGRDFAWSDDEHHPRVAILDNSLAERLFPAGNGVVQRIRFSFMPEFQNLEVVGIVNNARIFDLHKAAAPAIYLPCLQHATESGSLLVRVAANPDALARVVGREIEALGHEYPTGAKTVAQEVSQALVEDRVIALLSGFFAVLALFLAAIGLYGLMSYAVSHRTREIGIRAALGAQKNGIIRLVLRDALVLGLTGIAIGIPCALAACRLIASVLFVVSPRDLLTISVVSGLLLIVALAASYLPARRASRIDPMVALRAE